MNSLFTDSIRSFPSPLPPRSLRRNFFLCSFFSFFTFISFLINLDEEYLYVRELSSTEEDLGQTKAVLTLWDLEALEDGSSGGFGVLRVARDVWDQEIVTFYKLGVNRAVGET
jgi:hypothetical protein